MRLLFTMALLFLSQNSFSAELRLPKYLKVWNETVTYQQALSAFVPAATPRLREYYNRHPQLRSAHQVSVDFLDGEQFFIHTPRSLILYNTSSLAEGTLLISRRPFHLRQDEPLAELESRLDEVTRGRPTKSFFGGKQRFLEQLSRLLFFQPAQAGVAPALEWAPVISLLEIFWRNQPQSERPSLAGDRVIKPDSLKKPSAAIK